MDALRAKVIDTQLQLRSAKQQFNDEMEEMKGQLHKSKHELYRRDEAVRFLLVNPNEFLQMFTEATELVSGSVHNEHKKCNGVCWVFYDCGGRGLTVMFFVGLWAL